MRILKQITLSVVMLCASLFAVPANAAEQFVSFKAEGTKLCHKGESFSICISDNDNIAVRLAAKNLCADFERVCGAKVSVVSIPTSDTRIFIGTLGMSTNIDKLAKEGKIVATELKGKVEKYILNQTADMMIIAGSDRRGTVYGIYELSRQIGVSPWYYWMDTHIIKQEQIYVKQGLYTDGEPAVRYRGIFLNDEAPCLTTWVKNTFGTGHGDHNFYEKVFELVLRLKGNYIWPAMWGWAFYSDDPENGPTADRMGVMIGTSHHEPMSRSQKEWRGHSDDPNQEVQDEESRKHKHEWNYATNKAELDKFWYGGVERNKSTEDIITIGMRGDGDMAMSEGTNIKLLESIVDNQRKLIAKARGKKAKEVPQVWALYKEVMDYYDGGMRVPDDVIMLLCDDNWGDVRRVPTMKERQHKGGWGLYYHVDYVGAPRNTKTINVTPAQNMWEQLSLAYNNGIDKLWILNVGDLKPMEYPIQMFMDMAWLGKKSMTSVDWIKKHERDFCAEQFGEKEADEAARILNLVCKLNGRCTPEMLDAKTYNLEAGEWQVVIDEYKTLEIEALEQYNRLGGTLDADKAGAAYFQSILFPLQLMSTLHQMYYAQAMNNALHKKGDAAMNKWADLCEKYFKRDGELMRKYNKELADGKWNGMMVQKHIGYTSWNDNFRQDMLPRLYRTEVAPQNVFEDDGRGYISIEAEHFAESKNPDGAQWTVIPDMGRTLSAVTLMPQTASVAGASLTYKFKYSQETKEIVRPMVHVITKSTLDYLNKGGMTYSVTIDGGRAEAINFNSDMNEAPENIYDKYYPTIARRVIEKEVALPLGTVADGVHTLTFIPNDPGIVIEKIVIDFGGYKSQYLFGKESIRK